MTVAARVSLDIVVQEFTAGDFPGTRTYPASFERLVEEGAKVFARAGATPATLAVAETLSTVRYLLIQNTGTAPIAVSGVPFPGTLTAGQVLFVTNEDGWPAATATLTGAAGAAYKIIAIGE